MTDKLSSIHLPTRTIEEDEIIIIVSRFPETQIAWLTTVFKLNGYTLDGEKANQNGLALRFTRMESK